MGSGPIGAGAQATGSGPIGGGDEPMASGPAGGGAQAADFSETATGGGCGRDWARDWGRCAQRPARIRRFQRTTEPAPRWIRRVLEFRQPEFNRQWVSLICTPGSHNVRQPTIASLPRAGFGIRMGALLLDIVLVGIVLHQVYESTRMELIVLATYGAVMWKLKGSTIGGSSAACRLYG